MEPLFSSTTSVLKKDKNSCDKISSLLIELITNTRSVTIWKIKMKKIPNFETKQAIEDANNGINLSKPFTSVKELMDDLNADD